MFQCGLISIKACLKGYMGYGQRKNIYAAPHNELSIKLPGSSCVDLQSWWAWLQIVILETTRSWGCESDDSPSGRSIVIETKQTRTATADENACPLCTSVFRRLSRGPIELCNNQCPRLNGTVQQGPARYEKWVELLRSTCH